MEHSHDCIPIYSLLYENAQLLHLKFTKCYAAHKLVRVKEQSGVVYYVHNAQPFKDLFIF